MSEFNWDDQAIADLIHNWPADFGPLTYNNLAQILDVEPYKIIGRLKPAESEKIQQYFFNDWEMYLSWIEAFEESNGELCNITENERVGNWYCDIADDILSSLSYPRTHLAPLTDALRHYLQNQQGQ